MHVCRETTKHKLVSTMCVRGYMFSVCVHVRIHTDFCWGFELSPCPVPTQGLGEGGCIHADAFTILSLFPQIIA